MIGERSRMVSIPFFSPAAALSALVLTILVLLGFRKVALRAPLAAACRMALASLAMLEEGLCLIGFLNIVALPENVPIVGCVR